MEHRKFVERDEKLEKKKKIDKVDENKHTQKKYQIPNNITDKVWWCMM